MWWFRRGRRFGSFRAIAFSLWASSVLDYNNIRALRHNRINRAMPRWSRLNSFGGIASLLSLKRLVYLCSALGLNTVARIKKSPANPLYVSAAGQDPCQPVSVAFSDVFIVHHKVETTGFSRSALAARMSLRMKEALWSIDTAVIRLPDPVSICVGDQVPLQSVAG